MYCESSQYLFKDGVLLKLPKVIFPRDQVIVDVEANTKILVAARRGKANIRFGCASCKCGTCAVKIDSSEGELNEVSEDEDGMLKKLNLNQEPGVRMACRARIVAGTATVDLAFQDQYDIPDHFE